jgi:Fe2+ transport system protein B
MAVDAAALAGPAVEEDLASSGAVPGEGKLLKALRIGRKIHDRSKLILEIKQNIDAWREELRPKGEESNHEEDEKLHQAVDQVEPVEELRRKREAEIDLIEAQIKYEEAKTKQQEIATKGLKQKQKSEKKTQKEREKEQKERKKEQKEAERQLKEAEKQQRRDERKAQIDHAVSQTKQFFGGLWHSLGGLGTPGTIWLPIAILLIFFFLLLPVNGHTRAMWFWLAITGNARIQSGSGSGASPFTVPRSFVGVE